MIEEFWTSGLRAAGAAAVFALVLLAGSGAEAQQRPGEAFRDCPECPEMVVVPSGIFTMGSPPGEAARDVDEGPQRPVTIAKPFAIGKFEITFAEWDACVAAGGCTYEPDDRGWGRGKRPVMDIAWQDTRQYLVWLSRKTGKAYRLPSEAEWEYAARGGTSTAYPWGDEIGTGRANCDGCGSQWDQRQTAPSGSFKANAFGLHDMHGNVWEWTDDCWNGSYAGAPSDGRPWLKGDCSRRVLRGGSWILKPRTLRSADRFRFNAATRDADMGFRVVRAVE